MQDANGLEEVEPGPGILPDSFPLTLVFCFILSLDQLPLLGTEHGFHEPSFVAHKYFHWRGD